MTGTQKEPWARGLCEAPRDHTSLVLLDFIWAQGLRESPPGDVHVTGDVTSCLREFSAPY